MRPLPEPRSDRTKEVPRQAQPPATLPDRMAAGDEAALGALYDEWSPVLYPLVLHIVGDPRDAEEVLEEAFWQAWRSAGRYREERGSVGAWLSTMARSRALDRLRARSRIREEASGASATLAASTPDGAADPLREAEVAEERRIVQRALEALPEEQRRVLELAYFAGLSQVEIAARTGEPLGTVKTRTRLALQKLRDGLAVLRGRR